MEIKRDKKQFDWYLGNRGITGMCLRYLDWLASEEGKKGIKAVEKEEGKTRGVKMFRETIIMPVAILGCGMYSFFLLSRKLIFQR